MFFKFSLQQTRITTIAVSQQENRIKHNFEPISSREVVVNKLSCIYTRSIHNTILCLAMAPLIQIKIQKMCVWINWPFGFDLDERDCHYQTNFSASRKTVSLQLQHMRYVCMQFVLGGV